MTNEIDKKLTGVNHGRNFRELGGYQTTDGKTIKKHKLLRTGNLAELTKDELAYLSQYGVKYIVDFRSKDEVDAQPDPIPEGADYEYDPVFSDDLTDSSKSMSEIIRQANQDEEFGFQHMLLAYEDMITSKVANEAYRKFFALLLANKEPEQSVLFHCTAGKDRTGFGAILILSALGVPFETIKNDYLLTNVITKDYVANFLKQAKLRGASDSSLHVLRDFQTVHPEYFNHIMETITKNYGSIDNYLHKVMQLSDQDIADLRSIYLE
ncbi:tyrosine-protein phosphatase [Lactobacillus sp. ESL0791]|uniref:tyrosine-protein phosphatase n=1 Tax=Lactobacillus sp. ESL0791 TaxID=2983234 RepID=UPI0023F697BC|nr:tyrosine-protein phosphatase [Lactobacillus sp. ESL0791]MDF7638157.1 tyrosine-protein phosphatase [Lactobacillus sp. ESL0791]